jgi:ABC-type amino acid transport substrate-binding protein
MILRCSATAVSSITITDKRLESVSFAQPYYDSDQSLTVTASSGIEGLSGMSGKVVGVDTGSTGDMWAGKNNDKYKFGEVRRFEGLSPAHSPICVIRPTSSASGMKSSGETTPRWG